MYLFEKKKVSKEQDITPCTNTNENNNDCMLLKQLKEYQDEYGKLIKINKINELISDDNSAISKIVHCIYDYGSQYSLYYESDGFNYDLLSDSIIGYIKGCLHHITLEEADFLITLLQQYKKYLENINHQKELIIQINNIKNKLGIKHTPDTLD